MKEIFEDKSVSKLLTNYQNQFYIDTNIIIQCYCCSSNNFYPQFTKMNMVPLLNKHNINWDTTLLTEYNTYKKL